MSETRYFQHGGTLPTHEGKGVEPLSPTDGLDLTITGLWLLVMKLAHFGLSFGLGHRTFPETMKYIEECMRAREAE
eukprot:20601-Eustigmatos_ZCMA.PRE.1